MNLKIHQTISIGLVFLFLAGCNALSVTPTPTLPTATFTPPTATPTGEGSGNLITQVNFNRGGSIRYTQDKTLKLFKSRGWAWGFFPQEIDIGRYPHLTMSLRATANCIVYFELKDKQGQIEQPLVGTVRHNNVWKMRLAIPDTDDVYESITVDLTEHVRPKVTHRLAKVIVFSEPECDIEIRSIEFSKDKP